MSGEFGSYSGGYFHSQIDYAATDLKQGDDATTRAWAPFFEAFCPVARAISWAEAGDSSESYSIEETIKALPALKAAIANVEAHIAPYRDIQRRAIEQAMKDARDA